jgi:hypothetical protein
MVKNERALFVTPAVGGIIACRCEGCKWGCTVGGKDTNEDVQKVFDSHRCEDYPE